jgi:hypothetical protein
MPELTEQGLLPAEHRALRELHATVRKLEGHWSGLAGRLGGQSADLLRDGAAAAHDLLGELEERTAAHDLHGTPSAQSVGARLAGASGLSDLMLERNQALRGALLDLHHVTTLLVYCAGLARSRGDAGLAEWHSGWELRLRALEDRGRTAVEALAADPDAAIEPAGAGMLGRAGHRVASTIGALGEALDRSPVGRVARRG